MERKFKWWALSCKNICWMMLLWVRLKKKEYTYGKIWAENSVHFNIKKFKLRIYFIYLFFCFQCTRSSALRKFSIKNTMVYREALTVSKISNLFKCKENSGNFYEQTKNKENYVLNNAFFGKISVCGAWKNILKLINVCE